MLNGEQRSAASAYNRSVANGISGGRMAVESKPNGLDYGALSAGSDSADRCRSILASARDALVRPPHALSAYQARFTFSKMSRALAVQM